MILKNPAIIVVYYNHGTWSRLKIFAGIAFPTWSNFVHLIEQREIKYKYYMGNKRNINVTKLQIDFGVVLIPADHLVGFIDEQDQMFLLYIRRDDVDEDYDHLPHLREMFHRLVHFHGSYYRSKQVAS